MVSVLYGILYRILIHEQNSKVTGLYQQIIVCWNCMGLICGNAGEERCFENWRARAGDRGN